MEPQGGRRISPFRVTKRSTKLRRLSKTTRSRVHVQTVGLNAETKKCRHRADGGECLLTFPFIGLVRRVNQALHQIETGRELDGTNLSREFQAQRSISELIRVENNYACAWLA